MNNFIANGNSIQLAAPVGGVVGGQIYKKGKLTGVVVADAAENDTFTLKLTGVYSDCKKKAGEAWVVGDKLYCNGTNELELTAANGDFAGYAYEAALAAAVIGTVLLAN